MEERKMSKAEEIQDSLEACRDIYRYYKEDKDHKTVHLNQTSFRMEAYSGQDSGRYIRREHNVPLSDYMESDVISDSRNSTIKTVIGFILSVVIALSVSFLLNRYVIQPIVVDGISMEPVLEDGERLLMDKITYQFKDPRRYDVVVFPFEEDVYYIKRIIGMPGEIVQIKEEMVYINGKPLVDDDYGMEPIFSMGNADEVIILGDDEYFLLGDNRNNSLDSRYTVVGNIKREQILGRAFMRYYPFSKLGLLKKE